MAEVIPKCTHWLGHKFEGRYSEKPGKRPTVDELFWVGWSRQEQMIAASIDRTYERDICVRCGFAVEKVK